MIAEYFPRSDRDQMLIEASPIVVVVVVVVAAAAAAAELSTQCTSCQKWVCKKCSDIKGNMSKVMKSFICRGCSNPVTSTDNARVHHTRARAHTQPFYGPLEVPFQQTEMRMVRRM